MLLVVELGARTYLPSLAWLDVLTAHQDGYVARPSWRGAYQGVTPGAALDVDFTTDPRGHRSSAPVASAQWVTTGSSTTFGLGVKDTQVWPAILAKLSSKPAANLGLPGLDINMAIGALNEHCSELRGKNVLVAIQRDDLARTPAAAWLSVRSGLAKYSEAIAWWRLAQVPKGKEIIDHPEHQIDIEAALSKMAQMFAGCGAHGYIVQLDPFGPDPEQHELRQRIEQQGIGWIDLTALMVKLRRPGAPSLLAHDFQLSEQGQQALAQAIWRQFSGG